MQEYGLENCVYSADQVRELDRVAIGAYGLSGLTLMRRAAEACYEVLVDEWPQVKALSVFCGSGNNAGDGYILAGLLAQRGFGVEVIVVGDISKLGTDAASAYQFCLTTHAVLRDYDSSSCLNSELIVDALLGIGLKGAVSPRYSEAIDLMNGSSLPLLSVDIPSGLCADTGSILGGCVRATATVTFIGIKKGLLTNEGPEVSGKITFDSLDVPVEVYQQFAPDVFRLDMDNLKQQMKPRSRNSHKGSFGHLMVVGGDESMPGAVVMASEAALRTGAGRVTVATRKQHVSSIISRLPEVMVAGVDNGSQLQPYLENITAILVGPGLGKSNWSREILSVVLESNLPLVVDADALNLLAEFGHVKRQHWILTPHPGEAGRLLGIDSAQVQQDRFKAVIDLQSDYGGAVLLKGAGTLIATEMITTEASAGDDDDQRRRDIRISLCPYGNPGMATAGMGDVLSGVIGSLLAQGYSQRFSTEAGACLHSKAADICTKAQGEKGLLATDLMSALRTLINS